MAEQKEGKESVLLREGERIDDLERDGLVLIQNAGRFRYGVDAVLLSWFAQAKEGETVLDLCTGTGVIPILMTAKTQAAHFSALEIQPEVADMAARSVCLNGLEDRISVVRGRNPSALEWNRRRISGSTTSVSCRGLVLFAYCRRRNRPEPYGNGGKKPESVGPV